MSALAHCAGPRAHVALTLFELNALLDWCRGAQESEVAAALARRFARLRQDLLRAAAEHVPALFDDGFFDETNEIGGEQACEP